MILNYLSAWPLVQFIIIVAIAGLLLARMCIKGADRAAERNIQAKREERMQIDYKPDKKKPNYD